jgi:hypothetical protein
MKKELEQKLLVVAELQQALRDKRKTGKMKNYDVEILSEVTHTYKVRVTAENQEKAEELALEQVCSGDYDPETSCVNSDTVWETKEITE